mgnify:CR=1 FL=1
MCGISGIYSLNSINQFEKRITSMNDSIFHRGPDSGNIFIENNLALGHRRLAIIDKGAQSDQPMQSANGLWNVVFNGEIYNFNEIKEELNYSFVTNSDTEVILASVEQKGIDWFLNNANGMFAIALFNSSTRDLYLIRDRMGIKPLYYYYDNNVIVFASEIKAILSSGLVNAIFNDLAVDEYLGNRYIREPNTFFQNIHILKSGHILNLDKKFNIKLDKYWELPNVFNHDSDFDEQKIAQLFEKKLKKSIQYRQISDVPLGTFLSGGVDSSLITAIVAKSQNDPLNTYTIGFNELNEFNYAKIVSQKYKTSHHEILMNHDDYIKNWEKLIEYKDAPLAVPNEIPLAVMSRKLKEKITVVLSGEGADELMGGYGRIFRTPFDYKNKNNESSFYDYFIEAYEYVPRRIRDSYLNTPLKYRVKFDNEIKVDFAGRSNEENVFRFFHKYHVKGLLQRVDTSTMQASVEARVPFLDHNLIEFSYKNIPYDLKVRWKNLDSEVKAKQLTSNNYSEVLDTPKYLLRKISYKHIPAAIINRKKIGFPVPLDDWFGSIEKLARKVLIDADWLKTDKLDSLLIECKEESISGQIIWMLINIELFRKKYFKKEWRW